jgi:hypothetical protein
MQERLKTPHKCGAAPPNHSMVQPSRRAALCPPQHIELPLDAEFCFDDGTLDYSPVIVSDETSKKQSE